MVFSALMTMMGSFGRNFLMRGSTSKAFSSGSTTSVRTTSPSLRTPSAKGPLPWRLNARVAGADQGLRQDVRMALSSSAISTVFALITWPLVSGVSADCCAHGQQDAECGAALA